MDLEFALRELNRRFERSYGVRHETMLGNLNERGLVTCGERWKQERVTYCNTMEEELVTMFDSIEVHISCLTNRAAKKAVHSFKHQLLKYMSGRFKQFHSKTLADATECGGLKQDGNDYQNLNSRLRQEVEESLKTLVEIRISKLSQILNGRPNPRWNRPWSVHIISTLLGLIAGIALSVFTGWLQQSVFKPFNNPNQSCAVSSSALER